MLPNLHGATAFNAQRLFGIEDSSVGETGMAVDDMGQSVSPSVGQSVSQSVSQSVGGRSGGALVSFSHLRWDFVFQRPQHLLTRAARHRDVYYWEEPVLTAGPPALSRRMTPEGVCIIQPLLPIESDVAVDVARLRALLDGLIAEIGGPAPVLWFYTPAALSFAGHLRGRMTVYDCMDELAAFAMADPSLPLQERALLARADVVFTGGASLFAAKRVLHGNVHLFASGVDTSHFAPARGPLPEPPDQAAIPHPRAGFFGVIDERIDLALLSHLAAARPGVQFVMIGPTAKIDPLSLPRAPNLHYLGPKPYADLPAYAAHWSAGLMPFAISASTRFISPTKTPEYLAAGLPVVSTPIADVVAQYGTCDAVRIASADGFAQALYQALDQALALEPGWRDAADQTLPSMSWDGIWARMDALITQPPPYDVLIAGAGFAGAVLAERLAAGANQRVLLIDRRPHIGGNAYDCHDAAGVLIHPYGPHIFHTNSARVLDYLSRFTAWRPYEHRVRAQVQTAHGTSEQLPVPINRTTVQRFFGVDLPDDAVAGFLAQRAQPATVVRTAADFVLGAVGPQLYRAFFQGYTQKQWGLDPSELDRSVTARVPTRTSDDDRYFLDQFQVMPVEGYTRMFERMLDHPNITVRLSTEHADIDPGTYDRLIYTGPVDAYFGFCYGRLPYRSLRFEHMTVPVSRVQDVAVINYPDPAVPHTRITEFKHLTGQEHPQTSLCTEYPAAEGDPYYPIPRPENADLYRKYQLLADATPDVTFVGRLATYKYYNMDQVVAQALAVYDRMVDRIAEAAD